MKKNFLNHSARILVAAAVLTFGLTSCDNKNKDVSLPPIGGYNTSDDVAKDNLKAYWSFDGTLNESKSNSAPTTNSKNSFTAGIKGQALKLDSGYILYPVISSLGTANWGSITVSTWINTENQGQGSVPTGVFSLGLGNGKQTDWNDSPIFQMLENGRPKTYNDTLVLKSTFASYPGGVKLGGDNINDFGARGVDFKTVLGANKWVHFVTRYDGTGSFIDIFANGVLVSNNKFRFRPVGGTTTGIGPVVLPASVGLQPLIGGFANVKTGFPASPAQTWQGLYRGSIDQVRLYNKALSDAEIKALFDLETAGR
ncbi:MAG: LamG-like jellyroll fold domain-containing protein [Ginsengibacter sp.]|jgi:hypothetical protein